MALGSCLQTLSITLQRANFRVDYAVIANLADCTFLLTCRALSDYLLFKFVCVCGRGLESSLRS